MPSVNETPNGIKSKLVTSNSMEFLFLNPNWSVTQSYVKLLPLLPGEQTIFGLNFTYGCLSKNSTEILFFDEIVHVINAGC